jgi:hypothetical protein
MADSVDNNFYVSESLTVGSLEDKMYSQRTLSAHFARSTGAKVFTTFHFCRLLTKNKNNAL